MPSKWFICPDGEKAEHVDCFTKCRLKDRCAPLSYLRMCVETRNSKTGIHCTSLMNGARLEYLKALTDYAIDPQGATWKTAGTLMHDKLEVFADIAEQGLIENINGIQIAGRFDCLEEQDEELCLIDHKLKGSYGVMINIGVVGEDIPSLDENGKIVKYKTGAKAGQIKTHKEYTSNPEKIDVKKETYQLNIYRMLLEKYFKTVDGKFKNRKIDKLKIFAVVRDGGLRDARSRGVEHNFYYIDIPILSDSEIEEFVKEKGLKLTAHYKGYDYSISDNQATDKAIYDNCPDLCTPEETWEGRRCARFCEVKEVCRKLLENINAEYSV